MTTDTSANGRAFVLGVDGVPWDLLSTFIDAGELPNFQRLVDEGVSAPLESTVPPTTPTAWPSIATGMWPDKHGIYGFQRLETDYTQRMNTSADLSQPALWHLLSPATVGNVPMTFPAQEVDGRMVSGMMSPEVNERFARPPELVDEIRAEIPDYEIGLNWYDYADEQRRFTEDLTSLLTARRELMRLLMAEEDWRLFFFVYTAPDRLQHLIWEEDVILEHYKLLDDVLGEVLEYVESLEANLFVVSDHGFGPISKFVHLNTILANEGLLTRKDESTARRSLDRFGITKSNVVDALKGAGIDEKRFVQSLPKPLVDRVAQRVPGDHALYDVDFAETVAFAHGPGHVYVNDTERFEEGVVSPSEVPAVRRELRSIFTSVTDPDTGEPVLEVSDGEEVYSTDETSPDLVVVGRDGYEKKTKVAEEVFSSAGAKAASHRSEGVFFARGPGIASGVTPSALSVVDVAPTVLHSVGEPVPETVDGTVATDCLTADAEPSTRSVDRTSDERTQPSPDDPNQFNDVEERLRGLGYME
ncbi:alkaline phosphatase family protein [Natrialbaceae archaeon A-gly3]